MAHRSYSDESASERHERGRNSEEPSPRPHSEGDKVRADGSSIGRKGMGTTSSHTGGGTQESGMATGASAGESFGGATTALTGSGADSTELPSQYRQRKSSEPANASQTEAKPTSTIPTPKAK